MPQHRADDGPGSAGLPWWRRWRLNQRASTAVEFALIGLPFCTIIMFIFAVGMHLYYQEMLDLGLHLAMRQLQTGNAQNVSNGDAFVASYLCPAMGNMVSCGDLHVKIQKLTFTSGQDFYSFTNGKVPVTGGALDLSSYASTSFCNSGASQFLLLSAIYVAPSLTGGLLPNVFSIPYGGSRVDAILSQTAAYSEAYVMQSGTKTSAPAC